jgi:lipopolysaccharide export LptBFGC system permease protein LptF
MSTGDPYSPPKAVVQDVTVATKFERRLLRDLVRMFDNEPARTALVQRLAWTLLIAGAIAMAVSLWAVSATGSNTFWLTVLAIVGAYVAGVSNFFFTSLRQWPIVRKYLDADRIRADYKSLGG